jgi:ankyrin repeat protein
LQVLEVLHGGGRGHQAVQYEFTQHRTALHLAAASGHVEVIKFLLSHGHPLEPLDIEGNTPLMLAAKFVQSAVVELLLMQGADGQWHRDNDTKMTALQFACRAGKADSQQDC